MTSTVPWTMDHDFTRPGDGYLPQAIANGRYKIVKASENPDYTVRDKNIVLSLCPGGEESHSYRREAECELVGDPGRLIVPEYDECRKDVIVDDYKRPRWWIPQIAMDTAFDPDQTAILFGYLDFFPQILVIEDEVVERRMTTHAIAECIKRKEKELGYDSQLWKPQRCGDLDERALVDLRKDHKLGFLPVSKHNAQASLACLRGRIADGRVRIFKRCKNLDYQLRYGIWNERGTDYQRSENLGHWDAGKALVYLNRHLNWKYNPAPGNALRDEPSLYDRKPVNHDWKNALLSALHRRRTTWTS